MSAVDVPSDTRHSLDIYLKAFLTILYNHDYTVTHIHQFQLKNLPLVASSNFYYQACSTSNFSLNYIKLKI